MNKKTTITNMCITTNVAHIYGDYKQSREWLALIL